MAPWPVDELLVAAGRAVPGRPAVLLSDSIHEVEGEPGGGDAMERTVMLGAGHPQAPDSLRAQIARIGAGLTSAGWSVEGPEVDGSHVRLVARADRDGRHAEVAVHGWDSQWQISLLGQVDVSGPAAR